ncbi:hypothetical protein J1614_003934 [Plenodomus biglobosus]|nr:hypothetical protein J1614_003934 [Plenodomus biglobosus]
MPKHLNCPGLKCSIYCNGRALQEFDASDGEVAAPLNVVRYIRSQDDTEYLISIAFDEPFPPRLEVLSIVYVDGQFCESRICDKPLGNSVSILGIRHFNGVVWKLRRFRFSKISVAEGGPGDLNPEIRKQLESIGTIKVEFHWFERTGSRRAILSQQEVSLAPTGDVPKKAIFVDPRSHQTTLREPESTPAVYSSPGTEGNRFAVFQFEYGTHNRYGLSIRFPKANSPSPEQ